MTLTQLRTFLAVAETGSVRAAAKRLVVTESAVSASVAALQRSLGLQLLRPSGRGLELTEAGEVYAGYVRRSLGLLESGRTAALGETDPEGGELRIAAVTPAGEQLVPRLLHAFRQAHQRVQINLEIGNRERVHELLDRHEVDLVVGGRPPTGWTVLAMRRHELLIVAAPVEPPRGDGHTARMEPPEGDGHTARMEPPKGDGPAGTPEPWERRRAWLEDQTWLLREHGSGTQASTQVLLEELDIAPPTMTIGSNAAIREAVIAGLGVSLMSRDAVARDLASGAIAVLDTPRTPLRRDWHLIAHPGGLPATAALFVRHVVASGEFTTPAHPTPPHPPHQRPC
ncbi:LysR substrate-binding domain-containing protein [Sphaerisporangium sp. NPDC051017]|uniref:LysR family transcriptional regulator n=1 Tax=Sphaerisporangium sp. NPDC051017 TaxID=3154636 RepID=UPI0034347B4D